MELVENATSKSGQGLLLLVIPFLFSLLASADASDIWQLPYSYRYEIVRDTGGSVFVICDGCAERKTLPLSFRRKLLSSLSVRASGDIPEKPSPINQIREKEEVDGPTHESSCLFTPIYFEFDDYGIPPEEKDRLLHISKMLGRNERVTVKVEGYTCDIGTEEYNQSLSTKRAEVVAAFLKKNGVNVTEARGKGECSRVSAKDRALDRRVEVILQINPVRKGELPNGLEAISRCVQVKK